MMNDMDDVDIEVIMPTNIKKYAGHIVKQDHRFIAYFGPPATRKTQNQETKSFYTYKEAVHHIKKQNMKEGNKRVKNIIYKKGNKYECLLTRGKRMIFDERDIHLVQKYFWHTTSKGYVSTRLNKHTHIKFHRLVLNMKKDDKREVDHKNRIPTDNRRRNLRKEPLNSSTNAINRSIPKNNTSGTVGVYFSKTQNAWVSKYINDEGKQVRHQFGLCKYDDDSDKAKAAAIKDRTDSIRKIQRYVIALGLS